MGKGRGAKERGGNSLGRKIQRTHSIKVWPKDGKVGNEEKRLV